MVCGQEEGQVTTTGPTSRKYMSLDNKELPLSCSYKTNSRSIQLVREESSTFQVGIDLFPCHVRTSFLWHVSLCLLKPVSCSKQVCFEMTSFWGS